MLKKLVAIYCIFIACVVHGCADHKSHQAPPSGYADPERPAPSKALQTALEVNALSAATATVAAISASAHAKRQYTPEQQEALGALNKKLCRLLCFNKIEPIKYAIENDGIHPDDIGIEYEEGFRTVFWDVIDDLCLGEELTDAYMSFLEFLLRKGTSSNIQIYDTPWFHRALFSRKIPSQIITLLLDYGVDITTTTASGGTVLTAYIIETRHYEGGIDFEKARLLILAGVPLSTKISEGAYDGHNWYTLIKHFIDYHSQQGKNLTFLDTLFHYDRVLKEYHIRMIATLIQLRYTIEKAIAERIERENKAREALMYLPEVLSELVLDYDHVDVYRPKETENGEIFAMRTLRQIPYALLVYVLNYLKPNNKVVKQ